MAWRSGSFSRSLLSTARASSLRSSSTSSASSSIPRLHTPPLSAPRLHTPPLSAPRLQSPRLSFSNPRTLGELGCVQSLLPLHSVVAAARLTSHLAVDVRACCELSQGTFCRTCQDR